MTGNEVQIRVTTKNDSKPGFESSRQDTKKFSEDFDRLITKSLKDGETGFQSVTKKAEGLRTELNQMRSDFAKTGNAGLFGDIKKSEKDLAFLEDAVKAMGPRLEKEFSDIGSRAGHVGGKHAGDEFVKGLPFGIGSGAMGLARALTSIIDKLAPVVAKDAALLGEKAGKAVADGVVSGADVAAQDIPQLFTPEGAIGAAIVASAVATLAPLAASAIGGAIASGVGIGVIGAGAMILKNTPRIVDALTQLQLRAEAVMKDAAWPLVEPFHDALVQIDKWIHDEGRQFGDIFAAAAPGVKGLTTDLLAFIQSTLPGVRAITQMFSEFASDPRTEASFEQLGQGISQLFETISKNRQTIVDTFGILVFLANIALGVFDGLVWAARGFDEAMRGIAAPIKWVLDKVGLLGDTAERTLVPMKDNTDALIPPTQTLAQTYEGLAKSLNVVAETADTVAGALADKVLGTLMNGDRATLHWEESLTTLSTTLKDNKDALSIHTAAGQADREAVLGAVQANIDQYDSMIRSGMSAVNAAQSYDSNTKALEKQMRQAGLTQKQVDGLIGKYKKVPDNVNTVIAMHGLEKAIEDLNTTLRLINNLHDKTITVHVRRVGGVTGTGPDTASAHASGGIAGGLTWVGERGAELVRLPQGSTVYPSGQSQMMAGQPAGGGQQLRVEIAFTGNTDTAMAGAIQNMVRTGKIQLKANGQTVKVG